MSRKHFLGNLGVALRLNSTAALGICGVLLGLAALVGAYAQNPPHADYDVIIRNGTIYDGTGGEPQRADVGIRGDQIAGIGDLSHARATSEVDAKGLAVALDSSTCCRIRKFHFLPIRAR